MYLLVSDANPAVIPSHCLQGFASGALPVNSPLLGPLSKILKFTPQEMERLKAAAQPQPLARALNALGFK